MNEDLTRLQQNQIQLLEALNRANAERRVLNVILQVMVGQYVGNQKDWKGKLEHMRKASETAIEHFEPYGEIAEPDYIASMKLVSFEFFDEISAALDKSLGKQ